MAEAALKKLEDQLNCLICHDTYTDPKQLQCHHVYCQKCLDELVVHRQQAGQLVLKCPSCREPTPIPNGVAGLQSAFQTNHLLDIMEEHKKATASAGVEVESDSTRLTSYGTKAVFCREHGEKEVELYCQTCEELICVKCVIKGGKHHSHNCEELKDAFKKYKREITSSLEPMEKQLSTIKKALAQLDRRCGEISGQQATIEANIHDTFGQLHETLNVRETKLITQLQQITQKKLKDLAVQRDQIKTTLAKLGSCMDVMKESLNTDNETGVIMNKLTMEKHVKELTIASQPEMLKPNTEADMMLSAIEDLTAVCQNYGRVSLKSSPDPSKCHATGNGTVVAAVGEKSTAVIQAISFKDQPCEELIESLECALVFDSEKRSTRSTGSVERRGKSQYKISYQPTTKGRHQLHVKIEGQHIRGSPFSITVLRKLDTPILMIDGVEEPYGVAINQRGEVVITEKKKNCVSVFSPSGEKIRSFGSQGSNQGRFSKPLGVAVDGEGNILVADCDNCRIQKFTEEGRFLKAVRFKDKSGPTDLAFNSTNNKVYVVADCSIQVLTSDLTLSSSFGLPGPEKGQFNNPHGIACDGTGNVFVADTNNDRVQVFTAEGKFLRVFHKRGDGGRDIACPGSIAVDASGTVYVLERRSNRISVFISDGQFVTSFGKLGSNPGEFKSPCMLAVDSGCAVYVCDKDNNRIQVFN